MGDFTLGCLLGQYDRAQSFDITSNNISNVNSWEKFDDSSLYFVTEIHSSNQGLRQEIFPPNGVPGDDSIHYDYSENNDVYQRWFPDITTHTGRSDCWARINDASFSGGLSFDILSNAVVVPANTVLQPLASTSSVITSESSILAAFKKTDLWAGYFVSSFGLIIDDVLTQIDLIIIHPEYSFLEQARTIQTQHRSIGGEYRVSVWEKYFAYSIPLRFLSNSHADLINWWWENKFNLVFTLNTSDSESMYITQIVNQQQPIGKRIRPYNDLWEGVIQLESIDKGSLIF